MKFLAGGPSWECDLDYFAVGSLMTMKYDTYLFKTPNCYNVLNYNDVSCTWYRDQVGLIIQSLITPAAKDRRIMVLTKGKVGWTHMFGRSYVTRHA